MSRAPRVTFREEWTGSGEPRYAVLENGRKVARFDSERERDEWCRDEYGEAWEGASDE